MFVVLSLSKKLELWFKTNFFGLEKVGHIAVVFVYIKNNNNNMYFISKTYIKPNTKLNSCSPTLGEKFLSRATFNTCSSEEHKPIKNALAVSNI